MDTIESPKPMFASSLALGALLFTLFAYAVNQILKIGQRPKYLPPGPPTRPIWGNLKDMDPMLPKDSFTKWAREYGPVYSVMLGATPHIIVSGGDAARELFTKRGQATSGRPPSRIDLLMRDGYLPSSMTGRKWRAARKLWHTILNVGAARQYLPYQTLETAKLLADIADDPQRWRVHLDRMSNSVGLTMTSGQRVPSPDDPAIAEVVDDVWQFGMLAMSATFLENWPSLWKLPAWLIPARGKALKVAVTHADLIMDLWERSKKRTLEGGAKLPSFNQAIHDQIQAGRADVTEREGAEVSGSLFLAATDTTASTMGNWVAAMAAFPEAQRKAREEIDRVVGPDRMPDESDYANLPYVRQVIQETHRWITVAPVALPHAATQHIQWGKYHIPAGTGMILNSYAIHNDPAVYPEPRAFRPERWDGKLDAEQTTLADDALGARTELFMFGAGRRVCPGQHLAERSLFLAISGWLWAFEIKKAKGDDGREIEIDDRDLRPGLVNTMNPFPVEIKPRGQEKAEYVRRRWREQRGQLLDAEEQWVRSPEGVFNVMTKV